MKRLMKLLFMSSFIFILVLCSSCSKAGVYQRSVYDDVKKIAAIGDSYTYKSKVGSAEVDELSFDIKGFYGKDTVWEMVAEEECIIDFDVALNVKSGKFKLCLVNVDGVVTTVIEGTQNRVIPVTLNVGKNRVIMVGSDANCSLSVILPMDIVNKPVTVYPIQNQYFNINEHN